MFFGLFRHNLDSKYRLTIPSRYRALLAEGAYVLQGFDGNLMVFPPAAFQSIYQQVSQLSLTDETARAFRRFLFSNAAMLEADNAGRILIPEYLRQAVGIQAEVVLAGAGDHFEIWSPERWESQSERLNDLDTIARQFSDLNISTGP